MADNQQRQVKSIFLGNIHGLHIHDGYAGAVFDIYGISPALTTCAGGGREPHVLIVRKL